MKANYGTMLMATSAILFAPVAMAQTATPSAPAQTPEASTAQNDFSDQDIQKFAMAMVKLNDIQADATIAAPDKQAQMASAVQQQGLDPQKFNAIAQAAQSDPALQQKIQSKAAAAQQPAQ